MPEPTMALPGMDHPKLYSKAKARRRWEQLKAEFAGLPKTEAEFYLRFERLGPGDKEFIAGWLGVPGEWDAFNALCRFFKVKVA